MIASLEFKRLLRSNSIMRSCIKLYDTLQTVRVATHDPNFAEIFIDLPSSTLTSKQTSNNAGAQLQNLAILTNKKHSCFHGAQRFIVMFEAYTSKMILPRPEMT